MHETDPPVDDPSATHLVLRSVDRSGPSELTRRRRGMLTSCSVLVPATGERAGHLVDEVTRWAPPQFRVELVLVAPPSGDPEGAPGGVTDRLDLLAWSWTVVEAPPGGRGPALDRASAESTGEFVVVPDDTGSVSFEPLSDALGLMWVNGADALVIAPEPEQEPEAVADDGSDRRAERLGAALGIGRGDGRPAIVVLRRWVARFLLDDIGRAIDPVEEFADRVRLLELRLIEVLDGP